MYKEDIEKIFYQDVREKKKTGTGAFHQRGKGVKHGLSGALRTPYHYMPTKERKKLNSEVRTYNMYETILTKDEFEQIKDKEKQKAMLIRWREIYPNAKIMDAMGISNNAAFAKIVNDLDLPKKIRREGAPRKSKPAEVMPIPSPVESVTIKEPVKLIINGLAFEYNGVYDSESINKILTKIQLLLEGEENKFEIHLSVTEIN